MSLATMSRLRKASDLKASDVVIWFFGATGAGKTAALLFLILAIIGVHFRRSPAVNQLKSQTHAVQAVRLQVNGKSVVLVDTPGFDHANLSDGQVLSMISPWIKHAYRVGVAEQKVLYFHRINDNRVNRNILGLFLAIIGHEFLKQTILVTTMWNTLADNEVRIAQDREATLSKLLLKDVKAQRFNCTHDSALEIFREAVANPGGHAGFSLQKELVDQELHLTETHAGQHLYTEELKLLYSQMKSAHDASGKEPPQGEVPAVEQEGAYMKLRLDLHRRFCKMVRVPLRWRMKVWFKHKYGLVLNGTELV